MSEIYLRGEISDIDSGRTKSGREEMMYFETDGALLNSCSRRSIQPQMYLQPAMLVVTIVEYGGYH